MLGDGDLDDSDNDSENVPEVDLLEQLQNLQIGSDVPHDETVSKASSKVLLRSNPVFEDKRMSSKVMISFFCYIVWVKFNIMVPISYNIFFFNFLKSNFSNLSGTRNYLV